MIKAAVIGAGGISGVHLRFLGTRPDVKIAGICDVKEENLRARITEFGGKGFTDYRQMIDEVRPDAVWICTPPQVRRAPIIACADRGIPIFCEKPVERSLEKARDIEDEIERRGARVQVGYVFRSMPSVRILREKVDSDRIHAASSFYACDMSIRMNAVSWFYDKDISGGALVDQGTHNLDLLRYILGEVQEIHGLARNPLKQKMEGYTIDEALSLCMAFETGAVATHLHSWIGDGWRNEITLSGEKRLYHLEPFTGRLTVSEGSDVQTIEQEARPIHDFENEVFLSMVSSGDWSRNPSTYSDAVRTLELTLACDRAVSTTAED